MSITYLSNIHFVRADSSLKIDDIYLNINLVGNAALNYSWAFINQIKDDS